VHRYALGCSTPKQLTIFFPSHYDLHKYGTPCHLTITIMTTILMKSRVFCCSHKHAAIHDVYHAPPPPTKVTKPMKKPTLQKEPVQLSPAFRGISRVISEDFDDILSLKRANPVCDSDEEDFPFVIKRQRRQERDDETESSASQNVVLHWSNRISEDEAQGHLLSFLQHVE
jgi:hypothetical protein